MSLYDKLSNAGKALYKGVADIFGADNIILTSTKRNRNDDSQHNVGDAFDFKVKGLSNSEVFQRIQSSGLEYRQLIDEISGPASSGPHIHIGAGSGNENMIYKNGDYIRVHSAAPKDILTGKPMPNTGSAIGDAINGAFGDGTYETFDGHLPGRVIAIVIGVIFIGLAIAAFVFKNETAKEIVSAAIPVKG